MQPFPLTPPRKEQPQTKVLFPWDIVNKYEQIATRTDGVLLMQILRILPISMPAEAGAKKISAQTVLKKVQKDLKELYGIVLTCPQLAPVLVFLEERSLIERTTRGYFKTADGESIKRYAFRQAARDNATPQERALALLANSNTEDELW